MQQHSRVASVDLLRGLVMIVMALDHVRDYFTVTPAAPEDLDAPGLALFLTRWITHFCAPVFVFLAGTSAWLAAHRSGTSIEQARRFLVTRGLWLLAIEFLYINPVWMLWARDMLIVQVIWAIGWSMIVLGLCLPLGRRTIGLIGLAMIFGHNLFDGISSQAFGALAPLWMLLHESSAFDLPGGWRFVVFYPVVPWIGVMLAGHAFGGVLTANADWQRFAVRAGIAATAGFIALRALNLYGNPGDFAVAETVSQTIINFLNVEKYPPSLQYLLMTLGPALLLMPLLERWHGRAAAFVAVFGRVPFFYYILHFALILVLALAWSQWQFGEVGWVLQRAPLPEAYDVNLARTYVVWMIVVTLLYLPCRWYAGYKRRHRGVRWLSYL